MFKTYRATEQDFQAIEEGIRAVWRPEMDFVFKNKRLIENAVVVSYDSKFLYLWTKLKFPKLISFSCKFEDYHAYKIPHRLQIKDEHQRGWSVGLRIEGLEKYLPKEILKGNYQFPKISGSLLTPFIKSHQASKKDGWLADAYNTYESYLATIVHEFGHIYYNQHKPWWFSDKKENLKYLKTALNLYLGKKVSKYPQIKIPRYPHLTEVFAFCVDYTAASLFWPNHKKDIDKANISILKWLIKEERKKNLDIQDSVLDGWQGAHYLAAVVGKIILHQYPKTWPEKILAL